MERCSHDAYGACTVLDADGSVDGDGLSDVANPYLFTARRLDTESGLMQYRFRGYSEALGRFLQRDPLGLEVHAYKSFGSNPLTYVDPMGTIVRDPKDTYQEFLSEGGQIYTCGCGWLDQQHLLPAARRTLTFYEFLKEGKTNWRLPESSNRFGCHYEYRFWYRLQPGFPSSSEALIGTAERLSYQFSTGFEQAQSRSIIQEKMFGSAFSIEDQTSNYLGARLAGEYLASIGGGEPSLEALRKYVAQKLPEYCGAVLPGKGTWTHFKEKGWHAKKIREGRTPFLMSETDPCNTCPPGSGLRPEILDRPWRTWGFSSAWEFEDWVAY